MYIASLTLGNAGSLQASALTQAHLQPLPEMSLFKAINPSCLKNHKVTKEKKKRSIQHLSPAFPISLPQLKSPEASSAFWTTSRLCSLTWPLSAETTGSLRTGSWDGAYLPQSCTVSFCLPSCQPDTLTAKARASSTILPHPIPSTPAGTNSDSVNKRDGTSVKHVSTQ